MGFFAMMTLLALTVACLLASRTLIHYFQLESYQFPGYFRTLKRRFPQVVIPGAGMWAIWLGGIVLLSAILPAGAEGWIAAAESLMLIGGALVLRKATREKQEKKPLNHTPRLKRLVLACGIVFFALLVLFAHLGIPAAEGGAGWRPALWMAGCFPLLLPLWIALGGLLAWPVEKLISEMYFRDAQRMLRERPDLIKIGITGSWGKTSVKFILGKMLEEKYHTLITPASFNTPMGVTKVIRTQLEPGHRVFVAEMGARHVGDIKEMCRLVHPQMGVLTSVGPQHLDTFKTLERVKNTKYELIEALPEDGTAFFSDDGGICRELYDRTGIEKRISGIGPEGHDWWAENIRTTERGSRFTLCGPGVREECETELLGELNIRNILLAASVCAELGLNARQMANGIRKLKPVEHRLQLTANPGGLSVIDDAFNSNIRGAEQAFRVLRDFPGRRIVVTPGMVELGEQEEALNRQMGNLMAGCCDEAVLVGLRRSVPIRAGLTEKGFSEEHIHAVGSLKEAQEWLARNGRPGDTVLFENDLPDNYTE